MPRWPWIVAGVSLVIIAGASLLQFAPVGGTPSSAGPETPPPEKTAAVRVSPSAGSPKPAQADLVPAAAPRETAVEAGRDEPWGAKLGPEARALVQRAEERQERYERSAELNAAEPSVDAERDRQLLRSQEQAAVSDRLGETQERERLEAAHDSAGMLQQMQQAMKSGENGSKEDRR